MTHKPFYEKWAAWGVLVCFFTTACPQYLLAQPRGVSRPNSSGTLKVFSVSIDKMQIPIEDGIVETFWQGKSAKPSVMIIQDAHAVPDAQRKIEKIITFLENKYGVKFFGLEGAQGYVDAQIFKSFPDQKKLREVFNRYYASGELTGGNAAAVFSPENARYEGLEDWNFYEKGFKLFSKAAAKQDKLSAFLAVKKSDINKREKQLFSTPLMRAVEALNSFQADGEYFLQALQTLAEIHPPEKGSTLETILQEAAAGNQVGLDDQIKRLSSVTREKLINSPELKLFSKDEQAWNTGQISSAAFALKIKDYAPGINISEVLSRAVKIQKRLRNLEGTQVFQEFDSYSKKIISSLLRNEKERALIFESRRNYLLQKLVRLEMTRTEWNEFKVSPLKAGGAEDEGLFSQHIEFYRNAELRESVIADKFLKTLDEEKLLTGALILGGFHADGVINILKDRGISYALIRPQMSDLPQKTNYRDHMRGDVSWGTYLKPVNGKIQFYPAFVRGTRDKLLASPSPVRNHLLKDWRDQIIRDLAASEEISKAGEYTSFLDETAASGGYALQEIWAENIKGFITRLNSLDNDGKLNENNILSLFKSPSIADPYTACAMTPRSELRIKLEDTIAASLPQLPFARGITPGDVTDVNKKIHEKGVKRSELRNITPNALNRRKLLFHTNLNNGDDISPSTREMILTLIPDELQKQLKFDSEPPIWRTEAEEIDYESTRTLITVKTGQDFLDIQIGNAQHLMEFGSIEFRDKGIGTLVIGGGFIKPPASIDGVNSMFSWWIQNYVIPFADKLEFTELEIYALEASKPVLKSLGFKFLRQSVNDEIWQLDVLKKRSELRSQILISPEIRDIRQLIFNGRFKSGNEIPEGVKKFALSLIPEQMQKQLKLNEVTPIWRTVAEPENGDSGRVTITADSQVGTFSFQVGIGNKLIEYAGISMKEMGDTTLRIGSGLLRPPQRIENVTSLFSWWVNNYVIPSAKSLGFNEIEIAALPHTKPILSKMGFVRVLPGSPEIWRLSDLNKRSELRSGDGLVDPGWAAYFEAQRRLQSSSESLPDVLTRAGIQPDEFTELIYPGSGNYDNSLLAKLRQNVFSKIQAYHLISTSYQSEGAGETVRSNLEKSIGVEGLVFTYPEFYEMSQLHFKTSGHRIWIDKYPGRNGEMRLNQEIYKTAVRQGHLRAGDMILTVPEGAPARVWKKQIAKDVSIPGDDTPQSRKNWVVSLVTEEDLAEISRGRSELRAIDLVTPTASFKGRMAPIRPVIDAIAQALAQDGNRVYKFADLGNGFPSDVTADQADWFAENVRRNNLEAVADFTAFDQINGANFVLQNDRDGWEAFIKKSSPSAEPELIYAYLRKWRLFKPQYLSLFKKVLTSPEILKAKGLRLTADPFKGYETDYKKLKFSQGKLSDALGGTPHEIFDFLSAYNILKYYSDTNLSIDGQIAPFIKDKGFFLTGTHQSAGDILLELYQKRDGHLIPIRDFVLVGISSYGNQTAGKTAALGYESFGSLMDEWGNPADTVLKRMVPVYKGFSARSYEAASKWLQAEPARLTKYRTELAAHINETGLYKARIFREFIELMPPRSVSPDIPLADELGIMRRSELRQSSENAKAFVRDALGGVRTLSDQEWEEVPEGESFFAKQRFRLDFPHPSEFGKSFSKPLLIGIPADAKGLKLFMRKMTDVERRGYEIPEGNPAFFFRVDYDGPNHNRLSRYFYSDFKNASYKAIQSGRTDIPGETYFFLTNILRDIDVIEGVSITESAYVEIPDGKSMISSGLGQLKLALPATGQVDSTLSESSTSGVAFGLPDGVNFQEIKVYVRKTSFEEKKALGLLLAKKNVYIFKAEYVDEGKRKSRFFYSNPLSGSFESLQSKNPDLSGETYLLLFMLFRNVRSVDGIHVDSHAFVEVPGGKELLSFRNTLAFTAPSLLNPSITAKSNLGLGIPGEAEDLKVFVRAMSDEEKIAYVIDKDKPAYIFKVQYKQKNKPDLEARYFYSDPAKGYVSLQSGQIDVHGDTYFFMDRVLRGVREIDGQTVSDESFTPIPNTNLLMNSENNAIMKSIPRPGYPGQDMDKQVSIGIPRKPEDRQDLQISVRRMTGEEKTVLGLLLTVQDAHIFKAEYGDAEKRKVRYFYSDPLNGSYIPFQMGNSNIDAETYFFLYRLFRGALKIDQSTVSEEAFLEVPNGVTLFDKRGPLSRGTPRPDNPQETIGKWKHVGVVQEAEQRLGLRLFVRRMNPDEKVKRGIKPEEPSFLFRADYRNAEGKAQNIYFYTRGSEYIRDQAAEEITKKEPPVMDYFWMLGEIGRGHWDQVADFYTEHLENISTFWRYRFVYEYLEHFILTHPDIPAEFKGSIHRLFAEQTTEDERKNLTLEILADSKIPGKIQDLLHVFLLNGEMLSYATGPLDQSLANRKGPKRVVVDRSLPMQIAAAKREAAKGIEPSIKILGDAKKLPFEQTAKGELKISGKNLVPEAGDLTFSKFRVAIISSIEMFSEKNRSSVIIEVRKAMATGGLIAVPVDGYNFTPEFLKSMEKAGFKAVTGEIPVELSDYQHKRLLDAFKEAVADEIQSKLKGLRSKFIIFEKTGDPVITEPLGFPLEKIKLSKGETEQTLNPKEFERVDLRALDLSLIPQFFPTDQSEPIPQNTDEMFARVMALLKEENVVKFSDDLLKILGTMDSPYKYFKRLRETVKSQSDLVSSLNLSLKLRLINSVALAFIYYFVHFTRYHNYPEFEHYKNNPRDFIMTNLIATLDREGSNELLPKLAANRLKAEILEFVDILGLEIANGHLQQKRSEVRVTSIEIPQTMDEEYAALGKELALSLIYPANIKFGMPALTSAKDIQMKYSAPPGAGQPGFLEFKFKGNLERVMIPDNYLGFFRDDLADYPDQLGITLKQIRPAFDKALDDEMKKITAYGSVSQWLDKVKEESEVIFQAILNIDIKSIDPLRKSEMMESLLRSERILRWYIREALEKNLNADPKLYSQAKDLFTRIQEAAAKLESEEKPVPRIIQPLSAKDVLFSSLPGKEHLSDFSLLQFNVSEAASKIPGVVVEEPENEITVKFSGDAKFSRYANEDTAFRKTLPNGIEIAAVIDGVGGGSRGDLASHLISRIFQEQLVNLSPDMTDRQIIRELEKAADAAGIALNDELELNQILLKNLSDEIDEHHKALTDRTFSGEEAAYIEELETLVDLRDLLRLVGGMGESADSASGASFVLTVIFPQKDSQDIYVIQGGDPHAELLGPGKKFIPLTFNSLQPQGYANRRIVTLEQLQRAYLPVNGGNAISNGFFTGDDGLIAKPGRYKPVYAIVKGIPSNYKLILKSDGVHKTLDRQHIAQKLDSGRDLSQEVPAITAEAQGKTNDDATLLVVSRSELRASADIDTAFGHKKINAGNQRILFDEILRMRFAVAPEVRKLKVFQVVDFGTNLGDFIPAIQKQIESFGFGKPEVTGFEAFEGIVRAGIAVGNSVSRGVVNSEGTVLEYPDDSNVPIKHLGRYDLLFFNAWDPIKRREQGFEPMLLAFKKYTKTPKSLGFVRLYDGKSISDYEKNRESEELLEALHLHPEIHYLEFDSETTPDLAAGRSILGPLILLSLEPFDEEFLKAVGKLEAKSELRMQTEPWLDDEQKAEAVDKVHEFIDLNSKSIRQILIRTDIERIKSAIQAGDFITAAEILSVVPNFNEIKNVFGDLIKDQKSRKAPTVPRRDLRRDEFEETVRSRINKPDYYYEYEAGELRGAKKFEDAIAPLRGRQISFSYLPMVRNLNPDQVYIQVEVSQLEFPEISKAMERIMGNLVYLYPGYRGDLRTPRPFVEGSDVRMVMIELSRKDARSELREARSLNDAEADALVWALNPYKTGMNRSELRIAVNKISEKRISIGELEAVLNAALDRALTKTTSGLGHENEQNIMIHQAVKPVRELLFNFFRLKMKEALAGKNNSKMILGLNLSDRNSRAAQDYVEILTEYFSGDIERLFLQGGLSPEFLVKIKDSGILLTSINKMEKTGKSVLQNQSQLPVVENAEELSAKKADFLLPVGIRSVDDANPEAAVLARFSQVLYAILSAAFVHNKEDSRKLRDDFLKALSVRKQYADQAQAILEFDSEGNPVINARALQEFMTLYQAQKLTSHSA